ncbi:MAG: RodZ domain-containing protein [Pseudomonadota bacterium]
MSESARFGQQLKDKRQEKGLSIEEVGAALRLDPSRISAMENEAYDELPEPIYTRGYLRNYARLLQLDSEPLLKLYDASISEPHAEPKVDYQVAVRKTAAESPIGKRQIVAFVIAGVITAAVWFWLASEPTVETPPVVQEAGQTEVIEAMPAQESAPAAPSAAEAAPESQALVEQGKVQELALPPPPATAATETGAAAAQAAAPPAAEPAAPPVISEVTVRGLGDSWVEVTDASNKQLLFQLIRQGQVKTVKGVAPFRVILGYAHGVEILVDGKPYDHKPFIRKDIARFTIE